MLGLGCGQPHGSAEILLKEKRSHSAEIQQTAARHAPLRPEIDKLAQPWDAYDPTTRPS